ncbi:genome maintenance protein [Ceratobasidium sp. AG-Ba]|nr:genome maintenance protein [Ceratobasidium sp. AG-Ba]QRW01396.1 genome maintenance protein [Ceratobasidium sp. AG-Ba]
MFAVRRALSTPSTSIRTFSTTPSRFYVPRSTVVKTPIGTKTVARAATSRATVGRGNPEIVEGLPNTANEVDVDAILDGTRSSSPSPSAPTVTSRAVDNGGGISYTDDIPAPSGDGKQDWYTSFHGLSTQPFPKEAADVLMAPIEPNDVEIKPDGLLYLPEIKYRRILNRAFGPGGWGLAPRSGINVSTKIVSREYALVCLGRMVSVARGEQEYFDPEGIPTAAEGAKSNALMRCCKDLGVASELWDPRFIREFKSKYCVEAFVEHATTKKVRKLWRRKDNKFEYPYQEKGK